MSQVNRAFESQMVSAGLTHTAQFEALAVPAATEHFFSILTGPDPIVLVSQSFGSSEEAVTVSLYQVAATGGTPARVACRNLVIGGPGPVTCRQGATVTPNAPILRTTFRSGTTGNAASLSIQNEASELILRPNTQYVIGIRNDAGQPANMGCAISYRKQVNFQ